MPRFVRLLGALLVLLAGAACSPSDDTAARTPRPSRPPTTTSTSTAPAAPAAPALEGAQARVARVDGYAAADAPAAARTLRNPTDERQPLVFLVRQRQGGWLQVQYPERPNGATGWVRAADVDVFALPTRVVIEIGRRRLQVFERDQVVLDEPVAVGKPTTPTPVGEFYVDAVVKDPGPPYGAWELSVAGFSDVLQRFGGGNGQIAVHGWHDPSVVGRNVSNGCVRMTNAAVTRLAGLVGLGTPVSIVA